MSETPQLSLIVAVFNGEKFLSAFLTALNSRIYRAWNSLSLMTAQRIAQLKLLPAMPVNLAISR